MTSTTASASVFGLRPACVQRSRVAALSAAERHWLHLARHNLFAPRIALQVGINVATSATAHTTAIHRLHQILVCETSKPFAGQTAVPTPAARMTMVERVIERNLPIPASGVRVENTLRLERNRYVYATTIAPPALPAAMAPVAMVMKHEHSGPLPSAKPAAPEAASLPLPGREPTRSPPNLSVAAALPGYDLNRLTDAVVQSLDRRLTSYRERMGMI